MASQPPSRSGKHQNPWHWHRLERLNTPSPILPLGDDLDDVAGESLAPVELPLESASPTPPEFEAEPDDLGAVESPALADADASEAIAPTDIEDGSGVEPVDPEAGTDLSEEPPVADSESEVDVDLEESLVLGEEDFEDEILEFVSAADEPSDAELPVDGAVEGDGAIADASTDLADGGSLDGTDLSPGAEPDPTPEADAEGDGADPGADESDAIETTLADEPPVDAGEPEELEGTLTEETPGDDGVADEGDDPSVPPIDLDGLETPFESGIYTVGESGLVAIDVLWDGGAYEGQAGLFSLRDLETYEPGSAEFIEEAVRRVLSDSVLGRMFWDDATDAARFDGVMGDGRDHNGGIYGGIKTFEMEAGDTFGVVMIPNSTFAYVFENPTAGGAVRPLFSMVTANPNESFQMGQIADVTGDGSVFAFEDKRIDRGSDRDYNDFIFQVRGATGEAVLMDEVVARGKDWRGTDPGQRLITYANQDSDSVTEDVPVIIPDPPVTEVILEEESTNERDDIPVLLPEDLPIVEDSTVGEDQGTTESSPTPPFQDSEILRDDWTSSTAYSPNELNDSENFPETVDPDSVVNIWDFERPDQDWNPEEDGFGNPGSGSSNRAPVVSPHNQSVSVGASISASSLFSVADPDGDAIHLYHFQEHDSSSTSGYFTINGIRRDSAFSVAPSQLDSVRFVGGSQAGSESISVYAHDGKVWSDISFSTLTTTQPNRAPVITAHGRSINVGTSISTSDLFGVADADGDVIQRYYFYDANGSSTSGYFTVNGIRQSSGFYVDANQLNTVRFTAGTQAGTDQVTVNAYDGKSWGTGSTTDLVTVQPNRAPVVTTSNRTISTGSSISASEFFTAYDADSDALTLYFFDDNSSSTSGYFTVNGVRQASNFSIAASQLSTVQFVAGSQASVETVRIHAFDGKLWSDRQSDRRIATLTTVPSNSAPVVTISSRALNVGTSISASDFFSVYDADGDMMQYYYFYDVNTSDTSGYFTVNGVRQTGSYFAIAANQLNTVRFVAGSQGGTDQVGVEAFDGKAWSNIDFATFTTTQPNRAPVVTTVNRSLNVGTSISASDFFSVTDADGDAMQVYYFQDHNGSSTSGYFTVNGVRQSSAFSIAANQLSTVRFVAGSQGGSEQVSVYASDGKTWSTERFATLTTTQPNRAPVVTTVNRSLNVGTSISASDFFSVTDADGDAMQVYYFQDHNGSSTSGYFTVNGVRQSSAFSIAANQLSTVRFVAGSQGGSEQVSVYASDGKTWSTERFATLTTTQPNRAPVVTTANRSLNVGTSISASDFFSVTDADGDAMQVYYFQDHNGSSTSGYFTVNGVRQSSAFSIAANQLSTVRFVAGSQGGSEQVSVYASDGKTWSTERFATLTTTQPNRAPVVTTTNRSLNVGTSISASDFFSVTDADGDAMQFYYLSDANSSGTSGYFTVNGVRQTDYVLVTASQLSTVRFVAGSQGSIDQVTVYAHDGKTWSDGRIATLTTNQVNRAPVVTAQDQTVKRGQSMTPSFTVADADGDVITRYAIYDYNTDGTSGYFTINGVRQAAGQFIYLDASQLSSLRFVGGSAATSDSALIYAFDGKTWSNPASFKIATQSGSAPNVSIQNATVAANTPMSLNLAVSDKDGDKVTRYEISDSNAQATSGYFTINGVRQAAGQSFFVDADKLHTVKFVGGATAGTDRIAIRTTDGVDGWSTWAYADFATQASVTNDWFDLNIKDSTIRALARQRFQDSILCRDDMIAIFDSAKDSGIVDANEFADLRLLSSDTSYIKMADHARVLSQKIANGNRANAQYLGQALGNLYAGSSADHLQKLIDEHFFGKDLPRTSGDFTYADKTPINLHYEKALGELFQNGIQYSDVRQGIAGDCYYLAALAGVALTDSRKIQDMFIDNGDGTYTVRFFNNGEADYITVNRMLPTFGGGALAFAKVGMSTDWLGQKKQNTFDNRDNELWVALAEKAYAQINEAGWIGQDGTNSYKGIEGGWMDLSVTQIANWSGRSGVSDREVLQGFNSGKVVTFGSKDQATTKGTPVAYGHAYTMVGYDQSTGRFKLYNPWGSEGGYLTEDGKRVFKPGMLEMTWSEIQAYFSDWTLNG